jgi:hypothetical protein
MRNLSFLVLITISFPFYSNGQNKIVFWDSISNEPVVYANVFNEKNVLIALSNETGEVNPFEKEFPLFVKVFNYESLEILEKKDTIYFVPKIKQLEEVTIKPIDIPKLYQEIIIRSNDKAISDINNFIGGTYIEAVLIIDLHNRDSICLTKECDLNILKTLDSKTIDYKLIPFSGQKNYWSNSDKKILDTTKVEYWTNIIPKFNSLLKMDLSNPNKFKINFKNFELKRGENNFELKKEEGNNSELYEIVYTDDLLTSWKNINLRECNNKNNTSMCIGKTSQTIQFNTDSKGYFLSNCYLNGIINFQVSDKKYEIKLIKAFISNQEANRLEGNEYTNIEDYFKIIHVNTVKKMSDLYMFSK